MRAREALAKGLLSILRTRAPEPFDVWATAKARNDDGSRFELRPHQRVPARRLWDARAASVVIAWPAGEGKTYLLALSHVYAVTLGLRVGVAFPAEKQGAEYLRDKVMPVFDSNPTLAKVTRAKADVREFSTGGSIRVRGMRSASGLRTLEVDVIDLQEIDGVHETRRAGDEGDPLSIALRRVRGSPWGRRFLSSYPDREGTSAIESFLAETDHAKFCFPCAGCGALVPWQSDHLFVPGAPKDARLKCPECEALMDERQRVEAVMDAGVYVDRDGEVVTEETAPRAAYGYNCGFWASWACHVGVIEGPYDSYLEQVAAERKRALGASDSDSAYKVFKNTFDALPFAVKIGETPDPVEAMAAREPFRPSKMLPDGVACLIGFADPNDKFTSACVLAFGFDGVSVKDDGSIELGKGAVWGIHYEEIAGNIRSPRTWRRIDEFLAKGWNHPLGFELFPIRWGIDCSYFPDIVQPFCRVRQGRGVFACEGSRVLGTKGYVRTKREPPHRARVHVFGADALKSEVFSRWREDSPQGPVKFPAEVAAGFDEFFFRGLFESEAAEIVRAGRFSHVHYEKRKGPGIPRNEPLDCVAGAFGVRKTVKRTDEDLYFGLRNRARALLVDGDAAS